MKNRVITSLWLSVLLLTACSSGSGKKSLSNGNLPAEGESGEISFREYEHDFGKVTEGEKIAWIFAFENKGPGTLVISSANTSCGCTVTKFDRDPIPAGKGGSLEVVFDTDGRSGMQTKTISVHSNSPVKVVILKITAEVIAGNK
jgi:hypothetical protein